MTALAKPSRFDELEAAIARMPQTEFEVVHYFLPGIYARELRLPAGSKLTGKVHSGECLNIVVGDILVANEEDGSVRRIVGHQTFISKPGTRRAGLANLPTIWTCIHSNPDNETDLKKLEEKFIAPHVNPLLADAQEKIA